MVAGATFIVFYRFLYSTKLFRDLFVSYLSGHITWSISVCLSCYVADLTLGRLRQSQGQLVCPVQESCASEGPWNIIGWILVRLYSRLPDKLVMSLSDLD